MTPALNYYEYDTNAPNKLKTITNTEVPLLEAISAYSPNFDCVIVTGIGYSTEAVIINSSISMAKTLTGWKSLVGSPDLPQTDFVNAKDAS